MGTEGVGLGFAQGRKMNTKQLTPGGRILIASHNSGKVREIGALLSELGLSCDSAGDLGLAEPEETADTFAGNAELKALAAALSAGRVSLADDSGLSVDALGGAPGIYSARWAGPEKDFQSAMRKVEEALQAEAKEGVLDRRARFICALSLAWPNGQVETFQGEIAGHLVWPPRGERGFGYDPVFVPEGEEMTFGEMDPDYKHRISHRARAFEKLLVRLSEPEMVDAVRNADGG